MVLDLITRLVETLIFIVNQLGYPGIFIGMTIESSFFPFPSEVILIPAGALASQGEMSIPLIFLFSVLGSISGALINYLLALFLGRPLILLLSDRYGKYFFIRKSQIEEIEVFFKKHGEITTFVGRLIPGVRQLISLPAGLAKMNLRKFIFYTFLGAGIWSLILIYIGYFFGTNSGWIDQHMSSVTIIVLLVSIIILVIYFLLTRNKK